MIIGLFPWGIQAQHYEFVNYRIDDGLPSDEVYDVIQDRNGYMWFATDRGVSKYGGYEFENYSTKHGLPNNLVLSLKEDDDGNIWFGGFGPSLAFKKEDEDTIRVVKLPEGLFDETEKTLIVSYIKGDMIGLYGDRNLYELKLHKDSLSLFRSNKTMSRYEVQRFFKYNKLSAWKELDKKHGIHQFKVLDTQFTLRADHNKAKGKFSMLLTEGCNEALVVARRELLYLKDGYLSKKWDAPDKTYVIARDSRGVVWVGGSSGLRYFDEGLDNKSTTISTLTGVAVTSVCEDAFGGMWFTSIQSGVFYLKNRSVTYITQQEGLHSNYIKQFQPFDLEGDSGLVCLHYSTPYVSFIDDNQITQFRNPYNVGISQICVIPGYGLMLTDLHEYGLLIHQRKLIRRIPLEFTPILYNPIDLRFWASGDIRSERIDVRLNSQTDSRKTHSPEELAEFSFEKMCLFGGSVWNGSLRGLGKASMDGSWEPVVLDSNETIRVTDLSPFHDKYLSGSTLGKGVFIRFRNGKMLWVDEKGGLANDLVKNIYIDEEGCIWAGTNNGLSMIQLKGDTVYQVLNFQTDHGLLSNNVTDIIRVENTLWVGSSDGISLIAIEPRGRRKIAPYLYIQNLQTKDQLYSPNDNITLNYHDNIQVTYEGIDYRLDGKISYEYRLKGYDNDWYSTKNRTVRYSNLTNGNFEFQVRVAGFDNLMKSIAIFVATPYWKTWWFWLINIMLIVAIIRWRINQIKLKASLESKLSHVKQQALASQMNPHFLFNSLNSVRNFILRNNKDMADTYIVKVSQLVRGVLRNSFKETISLQEEIEMLRSYMEVEKLRVPDKFDFTIDVAEEIDELEISIPPSVLQPFVENAIWHGVMPLKDRKGHITVSVFKEENVVVCEIKDNGVGIDSQQLHKESSFGVGITRERIALLGVLHKKKVQIDVTPIYTKGEVAGTLVQVRIGVSK